jgi:hypothetical protein
MAETATMTTSLEWELPGILSVHMAISPRE